MSKLKPVFFALFTLALSAAAGLGAMHFSTKSPRLKGTPFVQLIGMAAAGVVSSTILFLVTRRKKSQPARIVDGNPGEFDEPAPRPPGSYEEWRADLEQAEGMDGLEQFVRKWSGRTRLPRKSPTASEAVQGFSGTPLSSDEFHPSKGVDGARGMQGYQGARVVNLPPPPPSSDNVIRYVNREISGEKAYDPWPAHRPIKTGLWVRTNYGALGRALNADSSGGWKVEFSPYAGMKGKTEISWWPIDQLRPALPKKGEHWKTREGHTRVFETSITVDQDMFAHAVWNGDLQPVNFGRGPA